MSIESDKEEVVESDNEELASPDNKEVVAAEVVVASEDKNLPARKIVANWIAFPAREVSFIEALSALDGPPKKSDWCEIVENFNKLTNLNWTAKILQHRYSAMKRTYQEFQAKEDNDGAPEGFIGLYQNTDCLNNIFRRTTEKKETKEKKEKKEKRGREQSVDDVSISNKSQKLLDVSLVIVDKSFDQAMRIFTSKYASVLTIEERFLFANKLKSDFSKTEEFVLTDEDKKRDAFVVKLLS
jgi:hypothetical protein